MPPVRGDIYIYIYIKKLQLGGSEAWLPEEVARGGTKGKFRVTRESAPKRRIPGVRPRCALWNVRRYFL